MAFNPIYAITDRRGNSTLLPHGQVVQQIADDGPTLFLDFSKGVIDPRLTCSRVGGATYVGPDNLIYGFDFATSSSLAVGTGSKSVTLTATLNANRRYEIGQTVYISSGVNNMVGPVTAYNPASQVLTINATTTNGSGSFTSWSVGNAAPRFDYASGRIRGLLFESAVTNLVCWSEAFTTVGGTNNWVDSSINRISTNSQDPASRNSALRISASSANASIMNDLSLPKTTRTFSIWLRGVTRTGDIEWLGSGNIQWTMNGGTTWNTQPITSSWTRYQFTATSTAHVGIRLTTSGDTIELWGAQVEPGTYASSYIYTGSSVNSRAADECNMTGTDFSSWFNATEGTFLAIGQRPTTEDTAIVLSVDDGSPLETMFISADTAGKFAVTDNVAQASLSAGTLAVNTTFKIAGTYKVNDIHSAVNGTLATNDTSATLPTVDRLILGRQGLSTSTYQGIFSSIRYWPTRKPNDVLIALTV